LAVRIEFESGRVKDNPKRRDLDRIGDEEYAILSRSSLHFIQCCAMDDPPWGFVLEYQDGSTDDHYRALGGPIDLHRIVAAFAKYLARDPSWQQDFRWGKMDSVDWSVEESVAPPAWITMRGREFEWYLKAVFESHGYQVETTKATGDQGVDLIVSGNDCRYAVQVKGCANKVGNSAVQEVFAGMKYYDCDECVVITNNRFTTSARHLAERVSCILIDRHDIQDLIAERGPRSIRADDRERTRIEPPGETAAERLGETLGGVLCDWAEERLRNWWERRKSRKCWRPLDVSPQHGHRLGHPIRTVYPAHRVEATAGTPWQLAGDDGDCPSESRHSFITVPAPPLTLRSRVASAVRRACATTNYDNNRLADANIPLIRTTVSRFPSLLA